MSDKLPQETQNEEVDLGLLFSAIGRLFEKLFSFISAILKAIFSGIIYTLKPLVSNFKIIAILLMVFSLIGFILQKVQKPIYSSDMLVRPYFDSKYQLANNIDYFNALIGERKYSELSAIFEIDSTQAEYLESFDIEIGPQTRNELLQEYNGFLKSIDSTLADDVSFDDFVENRDILGGSTFVIIARARVQNIFKKLENGIIKTFKNDYSVKNKKIRDEALDIRKIKLQKDLRKIDSIQKIYLDVVKKESEEKTVTLSSASIPLMEERVRTKEFELLQEEIKIRNELRELEEQQIVESDFYDVLSSFEEFGTQEKSIWNVYSIIFPGIGFILMVLIYLVIKSFKFIEEYE